MKLLPVLAFSGLAQAAHQFQSNGVHYKLVMKQNGVEVPVTMRTSPDMNSTGPSSAALRSARQRKRKTIAASSNWCGLSDTSPPSGTWGSVWGGWTVPAVSLRDGQSNSDEPSLVQWVGIDGDGGCNTGLIQGGTASEINSDGTQDNYMWFEFLPDSLQAVELTATAGNTIFGNVTMTSTTSGIIEVINKSTNEALSVTITNGPGTLCGASAEWILEDLSSGGGLVPFAEFPDTYFYDPYATTTTGVKVRPADANAIYIYQDGAFLCQAEYDSTTADINILSTA